MNILYANDRPGEYPASWYHASTTELEKFPPLQGEIKCDVCIIGAGYTGLSTALHLAEKNYDVALLDAHRLGWGASGRNGGVLCSGQRVGQADLEKWVGLDAAKTLWQLGNDANATARRLIKKHDIDCDLKDGMIHANHKARYTKDTLAEIEHLSSVYGDTKLSFLDQQQLGSLLATDAYYSGSLDRVAGHLHPLKWALGLARAAIKAGVRVFEETEVLDVTHTDPATITTKNGSVNARFVALCCNGYLGELEEKPASHIIPINNFIVATEPLDEGLAKSLIASDAAVVDSKFVVNYYRLTPDNRLLFGGGENYSYKFPADIKNFVRKPMLKIYPQLKDVKIDYGWGGTLAITMNRLPYFKHLKPNILTAGGFSGEGVGMGPFAGSLMADAIDGTATNFDVMAALPNKKFPGGSSTRRALLPLAMLFYLLRDRF